LDKYVCIHGHFYQPPRENPWLEEIEQQDSAAPYHDWNERIAAECYGSNARSRLLDDQGLIYKIINNYARISYNVGPTLLKWLDDKAHDVYNAIIDADQQSMEHFGGHGSACAQAYNHIIMPLANDRDKYTQVYWGIRDFQVRFGRKPEGMWLPETAVDLGTLDIMAELGIKFTIFAPNQAKRVRIGEEWIDVTGDRVDPSRAYTVHLPSGRTITAFFYDGPLARSVAFEGVLTNGAAFRDRLLSGFSEERSWAQLVNIATDGESYGHHHRFGDMALGFVLEHLADDGQAQLANYAAFLAEHPAEAEAEIVDDSSWSCAHGVERWRSNCGCSTGGGEGWNQEWRAPLREALDWLRDAVVPQYEEKAKEYFNDPWEARNQYIDVILDRSDENVHAFLKQHGKGAFDGERLTTAMELLELQRHAMLMFTSCGWFFNELSGIETTQVLQYAGRVTQLGQKLFGDHLEEQFLQRLEPAQSNIPEHGNGRTIWEKFVRPAMVDLPKVAAHFAVSSLFEEYTNPCRIYCYTAETTEYQRKRSGAAQLAVGRVRLTSDITFESQELTFGVVHFGDHNIAAGVRPFQGDEAFAGLETEAIAAFERADLPETVRVLDRHFGELTYSLLSLFKDEQRKILDVVLAGSLAEAEGAYRGVFEHQASLMRFLQESQYPMPTGFQASAELVIAARLREALTTEPIAIDRVREVLADAATWRIGLDTSGMAYVAEQTLERIARRFAANPADLEALRMLEASTAAIKELPFQVDLSDTQNYYWGVLQDYAPTVKGRRKGTAAGDASWLETFRTLGANLSMRVD
jgi:alpha-amylase/alpha-mannosidase (GH57 family)